jgi:hypothetical protein
MPYISAEERPGIDERVEALAEEVSGALAREENKDTEISVHYRETFVAVARALLQLERGKKVLKVPGHVRSLAIEVFGETGKSSGDRGAWLGRLNYALTRLIQVVPEKMVEKGVWKEEFRYWVYAMTVGALARSAMEVHALEGEGWPADGLVGVLVDVKDEYKRRVNSAYEAFQIRKAGDCYGTRYRTELSEVRDAAGRVLGYSDVMKDFGQTSG